MAVVTAVAADEPDPIPEAINMLALAGMVATPIPGHALHCNGRCSRWIVADSPTCLPYPCQCPKTRASAPEHIADPTCWWRDKATGKIKSRCPCWGDTRTGKPGDCCAHHSANPAYLTVLSAIEGADASEPVGDLPEAGSEDPGRPADADAVSWDDDARDDRDAWRDLRHRAEPYVRRWPPADLRCEHPLPTKGIHCQSCCTVYATDLAFGMHRPVWTKACRRPEDIVDVDTGKPLLYVNSDGAWSMNWAANTEP